MNIKVPIVFICFYSAICFALQPNLGEIEHSTLKSSVWLKKNKKEKKNKKLLIASLAVNLSN